MRIEDNREGAMRTHRGQRRGCGDSKRMGKGHGGTQREGEGTWREGGLSVLNRWMRVAVLPE